MRFQVPQFIETESKIIGPFTLKQFIYIAAGVVAIFLLRYALSSLFFWIMVSLPIGAIALALAFAKIDGISLPRYIMLAISFVFGGKKYIYTKEESKTDEFGLPDIKK